MHGGLEEQVSRTTPASPMFPRSDPLRAQRIGRTGLRNHARVKTRGKAKMKSEPRPTTGAAEACLTRGMKSSASSWPRHLRFLVGCHLSTARMIAIYTLFHMLKELGSLGKLLYSSKQLDENPE